MNRGRNFICEFCDTDQPQQKKLVTVARRRQGQWFKVEDARPITAWMMSLPLKA